MKHLKIRFKRPKYNHNRSNPSDYEKRIQRESRYRPSEEEERAQESVLLFNKCPNNDGHQFRTISGHGMKYESACVFCGLIKHEWWARSCEGIKNYRGLNLRSYPSKGEEIDFRSSSDWKKKTKGDKDV